MSYLICPTFSNASQLFCFVSSALSRLQSLPTDSKICIKSQKAPGSSCSSGAEGILHTSTHSLLYSESYFLLRDAWGSSKDIPLIISTDISGCKQGMHAWNFSMRNSRYGMYLISCISVTNCSATHYPWLVCY